MRQSSQKWTDLIIALCVLCIFILLFLFLLTPSKYPILAKMRQGVFGTNLLEAVSSMQNETSQNQSEGSGSGTNSNQSGEGNQEGDSASGNEGQNAGENESGNQSGKNGALAGNPQSASQSNAQGTSERGNGQGGPNYSDPATAANVPRFTRGNAYTNRIVDREIGRFDLSETSTAITNRPPQAGFGGNDTPANGIGNSTNGVANPLAPVDLVQGNPFATRPMTETRPINNSTNNSPPPLSLSSTPRNAVVLSDPLNDRLQIAGARSGDITVSLFWNNKNDLDLHVTDPGGDEIYWRQSNRASRSGGQLNIDANNGGKPLIDTPIEHIYWPTRAAPPGVYRVEVNHFQLQRGAPNPTLFTVRIYVKGTIQLYSGSIAAGQRKFIATFTNYAVANP